MEHSREPYKHAPEDFDVICEVCGTKWDFVDDKAVCPCCGDTLNKVEIATLKEEAYIRRRRKELQSIDPKKEKRKKKKRMPKKGILLSFLITTSIFVIAGYCFYNFCPEYAEPVIDFVKRLFS